MPANLAEIDGRVSIAYLGQTPWHGLGTKITPEMARDVAAVRKAAGLDWQVSLAPMGYPSPAGWVTVKDTQAVLRSSAAGPVYLSSVGPDYTVIQNEDAMRTLEDMVTRLGCQVATAGALGNGSECWALVQMPDALIDVGGTGDTVKGYAFLRWGHTGNLSYLVDLTLIRVVCQNTYNAALADLLGKAGSVARVMHRANAAERLHDAEAVLSGLTEAAIKTGETFASLRNRIIGPADVARYIQTVFPSTETDAKTGAPIVSPILKARRQTISQLVWLGKGADLAGSTADGNTTPWAVWNAVTEYFDHVRPAEAKTDNARKAAQSSALFGGYNDVKARALVAARQLVAA